MKCRLMILAATMGAGLLCSEAQAQYSTWSRSDVRVTKISPVANRTVVRMGDPVQADGAIVGKDAIIEGGAPLGGCDHCGGGGYGYAGGYAGGGCNGIWDGYCGGGGCGHRGLLGSHRGCGFVKHGCGYHYAGLGYAGCCSSWASPWWGWGYSGCNSCGYGGYGYGGYGYGGGYACGGGCGTGCGLSRGLLHRHGGGLGLCHRRAGDCCVLGDSCSDAGCSGCAANGYDGPIQGPVQGPMKGKIIDDAPVAPQPEPAPAVDGKSASRTGSYRYNTSYRSSLPVGVGR